MPQVRSCARRCPAGDKFAIVSPSYSSGQMSTPRPEDVVFGVDGDGI